MGKFYVTNTGCIRRGLDAIRIYNYLKQNGWEPTRKAPFADLLIVTTCGAVREKEEGSLNTIKKIAQRKKKSAKLIISGCLTKINPPKIHELGSFEFVPTRDYDSFDGLLNSRIPFEAVSESNTITDNNDILNYILAYRLFRNSGPWIHVFNKFSMNRTFIKSAIILSDAIGLAKSAIKGTPSQKIVPYHNISIAQGCMGNCTFCAIRFATGTLKSKPMEKIIDEFKRGLDLGYRYIQLVSEDTGCYGVDMGTTMPALLDRICNVKGDYRLIIIDFNPRWIVKYWSELMPLLIKHQSKIREIFIPIQSGSNKILKAMQRYYTMDEVKPLLKELNRKIPQVRLRTTMMIGFPGETKKDFDASKKLVQEINFFEVTLNKYEDRPNTASSCFETKIPQKEIDRRTVEFASIL